MHVTATCPSSEQRHAGGQRHVASLRLTARARRDTCHTCGLMAPHLAGASQNTLIRPHLSVTRHPSVRGHFFSNYQVLTWSLCVHVPSSWRVSQAGMLSVRGLRPHWWRDPGPGSGLLISPRPRPLLRLIILNSNVTFGTASFSYVMHKCKT